MKETLDTLSVIVATAINATYRKTGAKLLDDVKAELIRLYKLEETANEVLLRQMS